MNLNEFTESPAGKAAVSFLEKIAGSLPDIIYNSNAAINFRIRALRNQLDSLKRIQEMCEERKISIRQIKLNTLLPYLEGSAVEEEPELQNAWTRLMVNYLDANKVMNSHVYPEILKQISTLDLRILGTMARTGAVVTSDSTTSENELITELLIANLNRLNLIEKDAPFDSGPTYDFNTGKETEVRKIQYFITPFGFNFLQAIGYKPNEN